MKWKAAIFDVDGTLVDTEPLHYAAWVAVLKPFGVRLSEKEYEGYSGMSLPHIVDVMSERYGIADKAKFLGDRIRTIEKHMAEKPLRLTQFATEAISEMKSLGLSVAAATGSFRGELGLKLRRTGLDKLLKVVVCENDIGDGRGKPNPDIYLEAAKRLGAKASECIVFEDTTSGVAAAKAAGMTCFVIPNKYTRNQDFSMADGVFPSLKEAVEHVKNVIPA